MYKREKKNVCFSDFSKHSVPIDVVYPCLLKLVPYLYRKVIHNYFTQKAKVTTPKAVSMVSTPVTLQSRLIHSVIHPGANGARLKKKKKKRNQDFTSKKLSVSENPTCDTM